MFSGITLGLQNDISNATSIFIGILLHASLLSLVVSLTTLKEWISYPNLPLSKCAFIQLIMCLFRPIGNLLGLLVQNANDESTSVISAILMSLSTGVFLHVTFLSLIPSEFSIDKKAHCEVNLDEEPVKVHDPFNKEDCEIDKDIEKSSCLGSFLLLLDQNHVALTSLKALFFVCGWVTLSLLTLLTSGHHH